MWRVIHIDKNGENVFLETDSEYLARDTYKSVKSAVKIKSKGGLGLLGARLECDPDLTGEYEVVDEISVDDFKESKFSVKESLYKTEFPDYDGILYCPDGFKDVSYHNDTMPHVRKEIQVNGRDIEINIWQDYKDVDKREYDYTDRFVFQLVVDGEIIEEHTTNDLSEIKKYVADLDKIVDKALSEKVYFWNSKFDVHMLTNKVLEGISVREVVSGSLSNDDNYINDALEAFGAYGFDEDSVSSEDAEKIRVEAEKIFMTAVDKYTHLLNNFGFEQVMGVIRKIK